jgi:SAM-dependent methyltransferase
LKELLKGEMEYGKAIHRDDVWMAIGSSQIVQWLPIPVVTNWLSTGQCRSLLDIGCGAGDFLGHLNHLLKDCRLVGADRSPEIVQLAKTKNPGAGGNEHIRYYVADAMSEVDMDRLRADVPQTDAITIMFVLHELVYVGRDVALKFLTNLRRAYPSAQLFVCEIMRPTLEKRAEIRSGSELLLYHALSHQHPLSLEDWTKLFTQAGYKTEESKTFELMSQAYFKLTPHSESAGIPSAHP